MFFQSFVNNKIKNHKIDLLKKSESAKSNKIKLMFKNFLFDSLKRGSFR